MNCAKVAIIGAGKMGRIIATRLSVAELFRPENITLTKRSPREGSQYDLGGCRLSNDNRLAAGDADLIILSVKPQNFPEVVEQLAGGIPASALVMSIMTGVTLDQITEQLGVPQAVRCSTNIAISVAAATSFWKATDDLSDHNRNTAESVFACWGQGIECYREYFLDIGIVGVGSGPALVIELLSAFTRGLVTEGLPHDLAERSALSVFRGTVELCERRGTPLSEIQQEVLTPGGITVKALRVFDRHGLRAVIGDAITAAVEKGRQLGGR